MLASAGSATESGSRRLVHLRSVAVGSIRDEHSQPAEPTTVGVPDGILLHADGAFGRLRHAGIDLDEKFATMGLRRDDWIVAEAAQETMAVIPLPCGLQRAARKSTRLTSNH